MYAELISKMLAADETRLIVNLNHFRTFDDEMARKYVRPACLSACVPTGLSLSPHAFNRLCIISPLILPSVITHADS
jgi:hypothetical protein